MKVSRTSPSALRRTTRGSIGLQLRVGHPVDRQAFGRVPPRQAGEPRPPLPGPLGHPDQEHDLVARPDRPGVEHADDLEIVAGRGHVLGPEQEPGREPPDGHRRPPARWASASASQAIASESRPLASVTTRR